MDIVSGGPRAGQGSELDGFSPAPQFPLRDSPPHPTRLHPGSAAASTQNLHEGEAHVPGSWRPGCVFQLICSRDGGGDSGGRAQSRHAVCPAAASGDLAGTGHSGRGHRCHGSSHQCPHAFGEGRFVPNHVLVTTKQTQAGRESLLPSQIPGTALPWL